MEQKDLGSLVSVFSIENLNDRYRISGVSYEGRASVVDISKVFLDKGIANKQIEWIDMTREEEWKLASGPLYRAVCAALYDNRNHTNEQQRFLVNKVKQMFEKDFKESSMMTSTRIFYNPEGVDTVVHNFGYENEREVSGNIVGENGLINEDCGFGSAIDALLGTSDCEEVKAVYSWISGKNSYFWRLNNKPKKEAVCVLVLGNSNDWFDINANDVIVSNRRARGMVARSAENSP